MYTHAHAHARVLPCARVYACEFASAYAHACAVAGLFAWTHACRSAGRNFVPGMWTDVQAQADAYLKSVRVQWQKRMRAISRAATHVQPGSMVLHMMKQVPSQSD